MSNVSLKYESHCCGAPVAIFKNPKYRCTACKKPCIARQKKEDVTWEQL